MNKQKGVSGRGRGPEFKGKSILANSKLNIIENSFLEEALSPFGVALSTPLADALRRYLELLLRWNQKINLTATSDLGELLRRHIGESLFGARCLPEASGTLYDIGSGAGFPGLFLKLQRPDWELLLVECDRRKAAFLSEALRVLNFDRSRVVVERFESISGAEKIADVIVARALGRHADLLKWATVALRPGGKVLLWIGNNDAERLQETGGWDWDAPAAVPGSDERVILSGTLHI
ncbi:MAG: 16S rRNA (guanine(527)-N(7))-methyltransferase RsmG [Acidipila sp.]|nr:16S rRNA (guanine(527)-N(7))-methyltransferase RsmG [Acidipila sp.]